MSVFVEEIDNALIKFRNYLPELLAKVAKEEPSRILLKTRVEKFEPEYDPAVSSCPSGSVTKKEYRLSNGLVRITENYAIGSSTIGISNNTDTLTYEKFAQELSLPELKEVAEGIKGFDKEKNQPKQSSEEQEIS